MESDNKPSRVYWRRVELAALAILIPLVLILGTVLVRWPGADVEERPAVGEAAQQAGQLVTLVVDGLEDGTRYEVPVTGETTVEQILTEAARQQGMKLVTQNYGSELGVFVEAINGVSNDTGHNMYWYLYVNGQVSPVGASAAIVAPGDTVTWKYEKQHEEN